MRMDKYSVIEEEKEEEKMPVLSRQEKNKRMYEDVYLNSEFVDINNLFKEEESDKTSEDVSNNEEETLEEKSYDVNDYLKKAHEMHSDDNLTRNLNNEKFIEQEDEIRKLIKEIEDKDIDFFSELRGDNEDTLIEGKLKTDEFDESVYLSLIEQEIRKKEENTFLDHALSDETVLNIQNVEDERIDHTFEKIMESDRKSVRKVKKLPIIVFFITLFVLVCVILIIILK